MILIFSFALGFRNGRRTRSSGPRERCLITSNGALLITVGIGVGLFLTICMVRILTGIKLRWLLIVFYALLFVLASFTDADFLSIAFDSGGSYNRSYDGAFHFWPSSGVFPTYEATRRRRQTASVWCPSAP